MIGPYKTPQAFRMALETRLRDIAQQQGSDLQRLRRRVAFDQLLARLFVDEDPLWLLKGGYALELLLADGARSTRDLDLSVPDPDRLLLAAKVGEERPRAIMVHEPLQIAAERDLGDGFQFLNQRPRREQAGAPGGGICCAVVARLAGRTFARFRLDVGLGDAVLGEPEWAEGSHLLAFADLPTARAALYPMEQQSAEKVHAYTFPWQDRDNTRVKDLVDLVLLAHSGRLDPVRVRQSLMATFRTRQTHPLASELPEPPGDWAESYTALAQELGLPALTLHEAHVYLGTYWRKWGLD